MTEAVSGEALDSLVELARRRGRDSSRSETPSPSRALLESVRDSYAGQIA
jgi:hypothetical protein